jgi:hypothetical protein
MVARLLEDPAGLGMGPDLESHIDAFYAVLLSACRELQNPDPAARPQYAALVTGPRRALQRWFSSRGRRSDVKRVSEAGLLRLFKVMKKWVDDNDWPDDDHQGEEIVDIYERDAGI